MENFIVLKFKEYIAIPAVKKAVEIGSCFFITGAVAGTVTFFTKRKENKNTDDIELMSVRPVLRKIKRIDDNEKERKLF